MSQNSLEDIPADHRGESLNINSIKNGNEPKHIKYF